MDEILKKLTVDTFENIKEKTFNVHVGADIHKLELVEVTKRGTGHEDFRDPFSLLFKSPDGFEIEQGCFRFEHEELDACNMFMTRVLIEDTKAPPHYEVSMG
ncbi:MAG: hypothetical protein HQL68_08755 [Magnetococcales bacterium]|nr:hypothetical protein [Magnetococcales bacterium]